MKDSLHDLSIEITGFCPLSCIHCSSFNGKGCTPSFLDLNIIRRIVLQALPLGLKTVSLSGGEPCAHPDLAAIVASLNEIGIQVSLYTCGVLEDYSRRPRSLVPGLVASLHQAGLERAIFNYQSARSEIHDKITMVKGSHLAATQSIETCINKGIKTELHIVPLKQNLFTLPLTIEYAKSLGLSRVSLLRFVPQGRGAYDVSSKLLDQDEYGHLREIIKAANGFMRLGSPFNFLKTRGYVPCTAAIDKLIIRANGDVFACEAFKQTSLTLGNIFKRNIAEIWCSRTTSDFRSALNAHSLQLSPACEIDNCFGQFTVMNQLAGKMADANTCQQQAFGI